MGLYDRDYSQFDDGGEPRFGGRLASHPAWLIILVINVAAFLINGLFFNRSDSLTTTLSVHDETLYQPWMWWRWLTYGFAHGDLNHIFFNMLGLFFFGSAMERRLGKAEFTRFYLLAIVAGGVVYSLLTALAAAGADAPQVRSLMLGASGAVAAVTILFCFCYPHAKILLFFVLPVKAWIVGVLFVAMNLLGALGGRGEAQVDSTAFEVHLAGVAFAAAYYLGGWNLGTALPDWLGGSSGGSSGGFAGGLRDRFRSRPKLRLHDPDKKLAKEAAEADRILQKIHDSGEASLTAAERRLLERYSRRIRGK
ncbi:rhomboid family intramembrane serine protease [Candidatus Laterigemmans baculatus]|uniref:rhomboid family intramembrane serine protease n=1 Tax=Candidatus Laterigemmans baculatus TaxID=2770505 RepID=UPI0013D92170|nr:rhomboid family intramembrane serine protease [Candidatus Laterigemmans baculatus]